MKKLIVILTAFTFYYAHLSTYIQDIYHHKIGEKHIILIGNVSNNQIEHFRAKVAANEMFHEKLILQFLKSIRPEIETLFTVYTYRTHIDEKLMNSEPYDFASRLSWLIHNLNLNIKSHKINFKQPHSSIIEFINFVHLAHTSIKKSSHKILCSIENQTRLFSKCEIDKIIDMPKLTEQIGIIYSLISEYFNVLYGKFNIQDLIIECENIQSKIKFIFPIFAQEIFEAIGHLKELIKAYFHSTEKKISFVELLHDGYQCDSQSLHPVSYKETVTIMYNLVSHIHKLLNIGHALSNILKPDVDVVVIIDEATNVTKLHCVLNKLDFSSKHYTCQNDPKIYASNFDEISQDINASVQDTRYLNNETQLTTLKSKKHRPFHSFIDDQLRVICRHDGTFFSTIHTKKEICTSPKIVSRITNILPHGKSPSKKQ